MSQFMLRSPLVRVRRLSSNFQSNVVSLASQLLLYFTSFAVRSAVNTLWSVSQSGLSCRCGINEPSPSSPSNIPWISQVPISAFSLWAFPLQENSINVVSARVVCFKIFILFSFFTFRQFLTDNRQIPH